MQDLLKGLDEKQDRVLELLGDVPIGDALASIRQRLDNMQATQTRRGTSGLHTVNSWRQRRCARGAGSQVSTAAP